MKKIDSFKGDYRFLSNFWEVSVPLENVWYPSVEHAYQSAKTLDENYKKKIKAAASPGAAKKLGSAAPMRTDWEAVKIEYMRYLVWYKFGMYPDLGKKLLDTGEAELVEGNTWGDVFWGVCRGVGQNWLGRILMDVRDQIRRNGLPDSSPEKPNKVFVPVDATFDPNSGDVFVFGSNLAGIHGAGAALYARTDLGALQTIGEGLMPDANSPRCYALPTKDQNIETLPLNLVQHYVERFIMTAWERRDLDFFLTRIGCGLAGYKDPQIAPLFKDAPPNVQLPPGWEGLIEEIA